jgi:hypothetical protein
MMARFRYGSEERENRYWIEGEERRCRMYYEERETIEHMWNGCSEMRERERKERGEIQNEHINEREIEEEGNDRKRKRWRIGKKI